MRPKVEKLLKELEKATDKLSEKYHIKDNKLQAIKVHNPKRSIDTNR